MDKYLVVGVEGGVYVSVLEGDVDLVWLLAILIDLPYGTAIIEDIADVLCRELAGGKRGCGPELLVKL